MRFVGHAFVDWDDTIAENIHYFHIAEQQVSAHIAAAIGFPPAEVRRRGEELDLATARRMGLVKESFGTAWLECYREFCARAGRTPDPATEAEIEQICLYPYTAKQDLLPGAVAALQWLHGSGFEVTIWTAGDDEVQRRKVRDAGVAPWLHRVVVVPEKTPARLLKALEGRDPARGFVVGNSLSSDIRPALAINLLALHVSKETWAYDQAKVDLSVPHYRKLESIGDLPPLLAERFEVAG